MSKQCVKCGKDSTCKWYKGPKCQACYQQEYKPHRKAGKGNRKTSLHCVVCDVTYTDRKFYYKDICDDCQGAEYHERTKVRDKEKKKATRQKNKEKHRGYNNYIAMLRYLKKKQCTPPWVDKQVLKEIYQNCPKGYQVDHIIPITHPDVCGLHVPWNLQYLTKSENCKKYNKLIYLNNEAIKSATIPNTKVEAQYESSTICQT